MIQQSNPIIELRGVSRSFDSHSVLRDIDLKVYPGETLVIIGESGCGKSVTIKLMMQLLRPSVGAVHWYGNPVHDQPEDQLTRQRLKFGFLFQNAALFDSLSVCENVAFGLRENTRLSNSEVDQIVNERLRDVGLPLTARDKKPAELSGGMRKRVGLARALALTPEVMFYDEPTTGLDPIMSDVINELIIQTRTQRQVTSVVITHDMNTVRKVADRVVMFFPLSRLDDEAPQIVFSGTRDDLLQTTDPRVSQFVRGEAGERLRELSMA